MWCLNLQAVCLVNLDIFYGLPSCPEARIALVVCLAISQGAGIEVLVLKP